MNVVGTAPPISPHDQVGDPVDEGREESGASPTLIPKTFDITIEGDQRLGLLVDWSIEKPRWLKVRAAHRACRAPSRSALARRVLISRFFALSLSPSLSPSRPWARVCRARAASLGAQRS